MTSSVFAQNVTWHLVPYATARQNRNRSQVNGNGKVRATITDKLNLKTLIAVDKIEADYGRGKRWLELARHKSYGPPYIKIGGLVRYDRHDLDVSIAEQIWTVPGVG